jgi:hypothetical protein
VLAHHSPPAFYATMLHNAVMKRVSWENMVLPDPLFSRQTSMRLRLEGA